VITFSQSAVWGWLMKDTTRPHAYAKIYAYWEKGKPNKRYRVDIHDGARMVFDSLEEAKAWASLALRT
jgi:hypothetical protein